MAAQATKTSPSKIDGQRSSHNPQPLKQRIQTCTTAFVRCCSCEPGRATTSRCSRSGSVTSPMQQSVPHQTECCQLSHSAMLCLPQFHVPAVGHNGLARWGYPAPAMHAQQRETQRNFLLCLDGSAGLLVYRRSGSRKESRRVSPPRPRRSQDPKRKPLRGSGASKQTGNE